MWLLAILACANNIREQYQAEKELALAAPPALGAHWDPELRIRLSDATPVRLELRWPAPTAASREPR